MTANDSPEDRDVCLRAGMDDYLVKPIQAVVVLAARAGLEVVLVDAATFPPTAPTSCSPATAPAPAT